MKVIKFTAIWCPACLIMRPRLEDIFRNMKIESIVEYDYDTDINEVEKWNIGSVLPVTIITDNNDQEVLRIIGEKSKKELTELIDNVLGELK